jgi:uncharacterized membrane protein YhaH (DUF805 family)
MDFASLYTKTEGRIGRQTFWIGVLILIVANIIITVLILPAIGLGGPNMQQIMEAGGDAAAVSALALGAMQTSAWASLVVFLIFAYPSYALMVKRRHDRNNNGLDVLIYYGLVLVLLLVQAFGLAFTMTEIQGVVVPMPSAIFTVLGIISGIYAIYLLVVLGFLRGTPGPNQYGPDPLGGAA